MSRRLLSLLPLLALAAVLAACGGGAGGLALDPVASAATKTADAKTFAFDFAAKMEVGGIGFSLSGDGKEDLAAKAASMSMDLSGIPGLPADGTMDMVLARGVMYMKMNALTRKLPAGKEWVKVDLSKAARLGGANLDLFSGADPSQALTQLRAAGDVQEVGTETIKGEEMTHYRVVVDAANAKGLSPRLRTEVKKALAGMSARFPADVWVDGAGLLRRMSIDAQFGKALESVHMTMTMNFSDFGNVTSIEAPAPEKVADLETLIGSQGP